MNSVCRIVFSSADFMKMKKTSYDFLLAYKRNVYSQEKRLHRESQTIAKSGGDFWPMCKSSMNKGNLSYLDIVPPKMEDPTSTEPEFAFMIQLRREPIENLLILCIQTIE